jgi:hypothetical protein
VLLKSPHKILLTHLVISNSRKEINSLGVPKKGWQKGSRIAGNGTGTLILNDEQKNDHAQHSALKLSVEAVKKPKSPMELERDWRRLSNDDEKVM